MRRIIFGGIASLVGLAVGILSLSVNKETQAQVCYMVTPAGETVSFDGICGSSVPSLQQGNQSTTQQSFARLDPGVDTEWMRNNCNNSTADGRFVEPSVSSDERCQRAFAIFAERIQNSDTCRNRRTDIPTDIQQVIDRNCNRFARN